MSVSRPTPGSPASRRWILATTILGSSMAFIDSTVVNIALPALQSSLGATIADVQWVVEAYTLFLASLMLTGGALGDLLGRKRVFAIGVAVFAMTSIGCGVAPTIPILIAARALQGVGAAMLVPGSLALISACFPGGERGKAIGTWSAFTSITMAIGPLVGGAFIDRVSWRAIFFLNVPLAAIVLWLAYRHVPESRSDTASRPDVAGAVLVTAGLAALVYGLIESQALGFAHPVIVAALAAAVVLLALFVLVERRSRSPMLPLALFRSRAFSGANALTLFLYAALAGGFFFLPMDLIQLHGFSATGAGAAMLPVILIMFAMSRGSGGLAERIGARIPLVLGPLTCAAGFGLLMLPGTSASYWTTFLPALVVLGSGLALTVAPLTTTVMSSVPRDHAGVASGVNNAVSETAGVLAVATLGLAMSQAFDGALAERLERVRLPAEVREQVSAQRLKLAAIEIPPTVGGAERAAVKAAVADAFVHGFRRVMLIASVLSVLAAACAWFSIAPRQAKPGRGGGGKGRGPVR
ncbi:MAG TPA: MFS transporter [Usitatibacter sp.]|nr:MFS transporter [Usitatibacter sp.]